MIKIECSEKDIEDYLSGNCQEMLGLKFIGRQISTPAGIIDILAYDKSTKTWIVIELKNGTIDSSAAMQCVRYCNFLNDNFSKERRVFMPLLIGNNLSDDVHKSVYHYDYSEFSGYYDFGKIYYTLFSYDFKNAISFKYISPKQYQYESSFLGKNISFPNRLLNENMELDFEIYMNKKMAENG